MQIRWYQQSSHGTKWAISERKRLPPVAIAATRNAGPELVAPEHAAHEVERPAHAERGEERDDDRRRATSACPTTASAARRTITSWVTAGTSTRIASQLVARPSAPHSTSAPSMRTSPVAGSSRTGIPVTKRRIAPSGTLPITESCGPVIPASVIAAVPPASTRASFVCTCVCVPSTAVTRPSRKYASATFSLVASAWKSTITTGVSRRASSTSRSAAANGLSNGRSVSSPSRLITATPSWTREAAARRGGGHVGRAQDAVRAREVGREARLAPRPVAERHDVRARGEQALGDLRGDPAPVGGVLAVDDAEVDAELVAQRGRRASTARRPARRTRRRRRGSSRPAGALRDLERRRRVDLDAGCGSRRRSCGGRAPASRPSRSRAPARASSRTRSPSAPTTSDGSARTREIETTSDGAPAGWMSIRWSNGLPSSTSCSIPTTVPSTGEYASVPGGGADVERRGRRPGAAGELVPPRPAAAAADDAVPEALHEALVRLLADRGERERAVGAGRVADRGHAALVDRELEVERRRSARSPRARAGRPGAGARRSPARRAPRRGGRRRRTRSRAASPPRRSRSRPRPRADGAVLHAPPGCAGGARRPLGPGAMTSRAPYRTPGGPSTESS